MKKNIQYILTAIAISGVSGGISALFTDAKSAWYSALVKSPLEPPPAVFGIAWGMLYLLLTISCVLVLKRTMGKRSGMFVLNGIFLILWCLVFFTLKLPTLALVILIASFLFAIFLAFSVYDEHHAAGILLIPFVLWLGFATYLNYYIVLMN